MAACQMLDHMGQGALALRIQTAIETVLRERKLLTRDLGGSATTEQYTDAVIARL